MRMFKNWKLTILVAMVVIAGMLAIPTPTSAIAIIHATVHYLNDIIDVNAPTPADEQALVWNNTAGEWQAQDVSSIFNCSNLASCNLTALGNVNITSYADSNMLYWDAAAGKWRSISWASFVTFVAAAHTLGNHYDVNATSPTDGDVIIWDSSQSKWIKEAQYASLTYVIDGGGSAITTGVKGYLEIPFACTVVSATLLADTSGSIVVDVWNDNFTNYPPTDADNITGTTPPTITSALASRDTTLTNWTTTIDADDILAFNVDSCTNITRVTLSLKVRKAGSQQPEPMASGQVGVLPASPSSSATLQGNVVYLGAHTAFNIVVRFFTPDTDTEQFKAAAPTDIDGNFTIYGIPPGTYDVGVKTDNSLSILAEDKVFTDGNTTTINFGDLLRGDLDGNDGGTIADYSIFAGQANGKSGDCSGYAGDWLLPECPVPPPAGGACYGYIIG